ncbi:hypothetical protein [Streptomyces sp. NBC_00083]|uniref:hypothetical protein n=1 Tax=Streptomyces sp. NBC_00083 TaxID=2975647 RepID=UPI00224E0547|nr:hypothetical protein [Streptomyces sp. NBC_00083]MCX5381976.1 hypothetical protein [Streptomyces sp. NBC_00083]
MVKRSRTFLMFVRRAASALVVAVLVVAGFWSSWGTAQHVVLAKGRDHGTLTVTGCADDVCAGPFAPVGDSAPHARVTIPESVAAERGDHLPVVLKPGTTQAVRSGTAGFLYAWLPLAGALLLASLLVAGGLRMPRTAWAVGLLGAATMAWTFIAL